MSFWAWGHGILVLELLGRFPPEVDLDLMWESMIDSVSAIGA
ncbi:TetR-like C-terminal domain-containing protein [Conyzicola sp.]